MTRLEDTTMTRSESLDQLATALAKAQGQLEGAKKGSENPHFRSKYADLASVVDALRGPLSENGLAYLQLPYDCDGDRVGMTTLLLHTSGQWIASTFSLPVPKADVQGYGSALTYLRRYGLQSLVGLEAEDDDGNAAVESQVRKPWRAPRKPAPAEGETEEQQAKRLFPTPNEVAGEMPEAVATPAERDEGVNRDALLAQIKTAADRLKLKAPERALLWTNFVGKTIDPRQADPAALQDLLTHLRGVQP